MTTHEKLKKEVTGQRRSIIPSYLGEIGTSLPDSLIETMKPTTLNESRGGSWGSHREFESHWGHPVSVPRYRTKNIKLEKTVSRKYLFGTITLMFLLGVALGHTMHQTSQQLLLETISEKIGSDIRSFLPTRSLDAKPVKKKPKKSMTKQN